MSNGFQPDIPNILPAAVNTLKILFLKRYRSYEVDETDDKVSSDRRDKDASSSKSEKIRASLTVADINLRGEHCIIYGIWPYTHGCHTGYARTHTI